MNIPASSRGPAWPGHGACADLIRSLDWSSTPLGEPVTWPPALRTTVTTVLASRHPMFLWWGQELVQLYNDAYVPSFGHGKHPAALGQRAADCWQEVWPVIKPQIDDALMRGIASWNENQLVPIVRNGRLEDVYWTYGYSPVFFDDQDRTPGGVLVVCHETTATVLGARRLRSLHDLTKSTAAADTVLDLLAKTSQCLADDEDVAAAALFAPDDAGVLRRIAGVADDDAFADGAPASLAAWFAASAGGASEPAATHHLDAAALAAAAPGFGRSAGVFEACAVPLLDATGQRAALLLFGSHGRTAFDDALRAHFVAMARQIDRCRSQIELADARRLVHTEATALLTQAPMAVALLTGPDHVYELANPLYCQVTGRRAEDLLGKTYRDAFPELVDTPLPGILDDVHRTGVRFETHDQLVRLRDDSGEAKTACATTGSTSASSRCAMPAAASTG